MLIPPRECGPLECDSELVTRTPIPCTNQTNVELETFGFYNCESLKVMVTGYAKIHAHAAVTDILIIR